MSWLEIHEEKRKWWVLAAMTTTVSMIFIDISVLPVALPTIGRELAISTLGLQWILNAYTLALTVLVLAGGRLADMWGLRKGFCVGLAIFALASALCGVCSGEWELILSRALQGAGGAILLPATQAIIISSFPPHQRGKAVGIFVSIGSIFLAMGPLIGGSLTEYLSWRYVFWINLPIAAIGMVLTFLTVPHFEKRRQSFDLIGFLTLGVGSSAIIIAIMGVQKWGWSSPTVLSLLTLGIILITLLFRAERTISHPLVDTTLIRKKSFIGGSSVIFCNQFLIMVTVFWALYFQDVLNYSPTAAGAVIFLANAPTLLAAPFAGFLVDRYGPRLPVTLGFSLICSALIWFFFFPEPKHFIWLLPAMIPFGFGIPLIFTPAFVSLMNDVPPDKRGSMSGINTAFRQFGATLGLAIYGTLFQQWYHSGFSKRLEPTGLNPTAYEGVLSRIPSAQQALDQLPLPIASSVKESLLSAYLSAFHLINACAAVCAVVGIFLAMKLLSTRPIERS